MEGKEVESSLLKYAEHTETMYQSARALRSIRQTDDSLQALVEWEGLPDSEDLTWEPLLQIYEDLPGLLHDFLYTAGDMTLKRKALKVCSLE